MTQRNNSVMFISFGLHVSASSNLIVWIVIIKASRCSLGNNNQTPPSFSTECCQLVQSCLQRSPRKRIALGKLSSHRWFKVFNSTFSFLSIFIQEVCTSVTWRPTYVCVACFRSPDKEQQEVPEPSIKTIISSDLLHLLVMRLK